MMNFLSEALPSKETIEFGELTSKLPELNTKLEVCKKEVSLYLGSVQERLEEQPKKNRNHITTVHKIKQDLETVQSTIDSLLIKDIVEAESSYNDLVDEFNEVTMSISIVDVVCEIHERLGTLKTLCLSYTYYGLVVDVLEVLKVLIKTLPSAPSVPFVEKLKAMVSKEIDHVNHLLKSEFKKYIILKKEKDYSVIKVPVDVEIIHCLLPAIYKNNSTCNLLNVLCNYIWEILYLPVIMINCKIVFSQVDSLEVLQIKIIDKKSNIRYESVYQNVISITDFLVKFVDCQLDDNLTLLSFFGPTIKSLLCKTILKECVLKSMPKEWQNLETFKLDVLASTKELEKKFKPHGWFDEEWESIQRIEEFYGQNRSQYFSDKAKEIMKRDLHNVIEVGIPYDPKRAMSERDELSHCAISSNIPDLIQLGEELISEMCDGPMMNRRTLFSTYKGIFFNYGDFIAAYHQKLLETIPQQVALFYNNCNYLFRQLQGWDEKFENHEFLSEFCDDSSKAFYEVEEVGRAFFNSFVDEQMKQIEVILKEANLHNKKTLDKLEDNVEKLVRQCLRQQELLKTVWSKVLSYIVYNKTIGEIFNSMCSFLVNSLVTVEDIESDVAENLIEIFKIVLNRGPKLFTDSNEIAIYVQQWYKFNELIFVLGASLLDINDRWADGKGPLALQFKPYELKQLIRALFQNTERRAAVLARIRE